MDRWTVIMNTYPHLYEGFIRLVRYPADPTKLTGDTPGDKAMLNSCKVPSVFPASDYDKVLAQVSEGGWGLEDVFASYEEGE